MPDAIISLRQMHATTGIPSSYIRALAADGLLKIITSKSGKEYIRQRDLINVIGGGIKQYIPTPEEIIDAREKIKAKWPAERWLNRFAGLEEDPPAYLPGEGESPFNLKIFTQESEDGNE